MAMQLEVCSARSTAMPWANLRLPPFPQVALRVMQLVANENVQLHQLCELISADPAFASEVLTIANSLLYSPRFPASSIMQAVSVLGANHLQGICVTVGVRSYLGKSMRLPAMRMLWRHNLATAIVAQRIASSGILDNEVAFTAGILHDIGRFALSVVRPKEYANLLESHRGAPASLLAGERDLFGLDHCEVGAQLVTDWNLPVEFVSSVSDHLEPRRRDGSWNISELVKVSCKFADAAGYFPFSGCTVTPYIDLLDELPARERRLFHPVAESLASELQIAIQAVENA
jgi:putative nucleotidyltransferase with HDIG domain